MSDIIQKRLPIDSLKTLVSGAGMGFDLCPVFISSIETGRVIKTETHSIANQSLPADAHSKILGMTVNLVFEYDAGYFIGGTFRYQSLTEHNYNFDTLEDCIAYTHEGDFNFGIESRLGDTAPFSNWWIQIINEADEVDEADQTALREEIARVGRIEGNLDDSYKKSARMGCMIGGIFRFYDREASAEVGYSLMSNIEPDPTMRYHDADSYYFDSEFVAKIDSKVRDAMRVALQAHF